MKLTFWVDVMYLEDLAQLIKDPTINAFIPLDRSQDVNRPQQMIQLDYETYLDLLENKNKIYINE